MIFYVLVTIHFFTNTFNSFYLVYLFSTRAGKANISSKIFLHLCLILFGFIFHTQFYHPLIRCLSIFDVQVVFLSDPPWAYLASCILLVKHFIKNLLAFFKYVFDNIYYNAYVLINQLYFINYLFFNTKIRAFG